MDVESDTYVGRPSLNAIKEEKRRNSIVSSKTPVSPTKLSKFYQNESMSDEESKAS